MRIVLVQPPKPAYGSGAEQDWELARPFSLFYLAAALERAGGHEVSILDLERRDLRGVDPDAALAAHPADLYGITGVTFSRFEAIRVARAARRRSPGAFVVAGGVHFMHCAEDTLRHVPEIDAVARGEGEGTIVSLAAALGAGAGPGGIPGLCLRAAGGDAAGAPTFPLYEDFDSLPPYSRFSPEAYPEYLFGWPERIPAVSVMTSRGCPHHCIFCAKSGSRYRLRAPESVVAELELLRGRFGVACFNFLDLTFTGSPRHVREVCALVRERLPGIRWWCESRVNIPLELLGLMRDAGCVSTAIGVESGSPGVLGRIGKGITTAQVREYCRECARLGIAVTAYFMYSHPGETLADARLTLALIRDLQRMGVGAGSFQPTMIFPGTELERIARASGALPREFSWCEPYDAALNRSLGQLPNVPLYRDLLREEDLLALQEEFRSRATIASAAGEASRLGWGELARKAVRAVVQGRPSAAYLLSPSFHRELLRRRLGRRGR